VLGIRLLPYVLEGVAKARSNYERSQCFVVVSSLLKRRMALAGAGEEQVVTHIPKVRDAFAMGLLTTRYGRGIKSKEMLPVLQCAHSLLNFLLRTAKLPLARVQEVFYDPSIQARSLSLQGGGSTYPYPEPIDACDTSRPLLNVLEELLPFHVASSKVSNLSRQLFSSLKLTVPSLLRPKQKKSSGKKAANKQKST